MTTTTSKAHPLPSSFQKSSQPPSASVHHRLSGVDIKNSLHHSSGSGTVISEAIPCPKGESGNLLGISSKNSGGTYQSALPLCIHSHPYKKYFEQKNYLIKQLTGEIELVEKFNIKEFEFYRQEHCPLIKTKSALISHCFAWIKHYEQQIQNVRESENG